ncbi:tetratricopeptide repeat protein [Marininema halotolerans]|uniref:Tetratricopeptide repeat-containing protein n=1 Tax=Marininema halotolerans TaxID=1155944 RepID=A0A1I6R6C6_9BACL|nr:tetratricopeptide repeat protein [Marininema halotolerans]SFS60272.1 hypothetical protein SAMN05444972_104181 [Marininema halotolerans]
MLGKWLTRAKRWLLPTSPPSVKQPPREKKSEEHNTISSEPAIEATTTSATKTASVHNPPSLSVTQEETSATRIEEVKVLSSKMSAEEEPASMQEPPSQTMEDANWLHFEEQGFQFSMPLDDEEQQVLTTAEARFTAAKKQIEGANTKNKQRFLEHQRAMKYWSLQIFYRDQAQAHYKRRAEDPTALEKTIYYCEKQIQYAPMAIAANRMDHQAKELPQHYGYKQLAIIYEKQGEIDKAIDLCKQAEQQGWKGDWSARIERYKKRVSLAQ